jgi:hypothetical protein
VDISRMVIMVIMVIIFTFPNPFCKIENPHIKQRGSKIIAMNCIAMNCIAMKFVLQ